MSKYTQLVSVPSKINVGISPLSNRLMLEKFGAPRANATVEDAPITNPELRAAMVTDTICRNVRVTGHYIAVRSLKEIMSDVAA